MTVVIVVCLALSSCYLWWDMGSGDYVNNYDNKTRYGGDNDKDWSVTVIFYGQGATVANVRSVLGLLGVEECNCGPMYMRLDDGAGPLWDSESGSKHNTDSGACVVGIWRDSWHVRFYADHGTYMHNDRFNKYVGATTHQDLHHGCGQGAARYPERAENYLAWIFAYAGFHVAQDHVDMGNSEGGVRWNGGTATVIEIK